jgi:hypothetical protein
MAKPNVKIATEEDRASVIHVIALAFSTDPAARWAWPNPERYLKHFPAFVQAIGGKAFLHGSAYCADGYKGAAL